MPVYFYWGDDDYQIAQAVKKLIETNVDPLWRDFNYVKINATGDLEVMDGLNQAVTSPFGMGNRLTWLADTAIAQRCSEPLLAELERTFNCLPPNSYILFTASNKPDGRAKSTKLLQKHSQILEFSLIPPWKTDAIAQIVKQSAAEIGLNLSTDGIDLLVDAIGNDTRRLNMELQKLQLSHYGNKKPLTAKEISPLVQASAHNSLQLASAIRSANVSQALSLVSELLRNNEVGLRICATLVGQFRTWLWIKLMQESGERDDKAIAEAAEVGNPKRVYFLKQEVQGLNSQKLMRSLSILLGLEADLKHGKDETATLQTAIIELCQAMAK
ncbi:DNA polymerase III subunit delta [Pseudanabaena sp. FACHB-1998]|uniref:DNA polymerase III subunit delta n=1 Tax=Pseudanabaena sp. FACHB-1998 TaxID=2692858 RepID=UPI0016819826|nr:DNA polymerase III subunit delta [Pseudanabaena sp. FACHB-1998]MBD2176518.1 DNA polymerase III subunit delta [Pseudanabaena sp. FACHB-1998]